MERRKGRRLYRRHYGIVVTAKQLSKAYIARQGSEKPTNESQWYCPNDGCGVRQVSVVNAQRPGREGAGDWRCPACGQLLEFNYYLREIVLVRAKKKKKKMGP